MLDDYGRATILVVEDDAALRRLIVRILNDAGFATLAAGKAIEGRSLVRQRNGAFDLAITDIVMPGMSGLDLATDLDREYPDLKILYISGYVDSIAADVISRRSPEHLLLKPFSEQALLERVDLLLGRTSRREPGKATERSIPAVRSGTEG